MLEEDKSDNLKQITSVHPDIYRTTFDLLLMYGDTIDHN